MVDETDIRNVTLGQPAEVRVDALEGVEDQGRGHGDRLLGDPARPDRGRRRARRRAPRNQAKDFKVTITLKDPPPALRSGPERHRRHHDRAARRTCWRVPSRPWWCARSTRTARSSTPTRSRPPRTSRHRRRAPREKGEEKEGVFVVNNGQVGLPRREDRDHRRDRHRDRRRAEGRRRDRDRLLQDPAHPEGRGPHQARGQEGQEVSDRPERVEPPAAARRGRSSAPRTSGAPTSWARRRSTPCAA